MCLLGVSYIHIHLNFYEKSVVKISTKLKQRTNTPCYGDCVGVKCSLIIKGY